MPPFAPEYPEINNLALKSNLRFGEVCCSPVVVRLRV
jgi:hypothetical protein